MQYPAKLISKYEGKIKIFLDVVGLENLQARDFFCNTHTKIYSDKTMLEPFYQKIQATLIKLTVVL